MGEFTSTLLRLVCAFGLLMMYLNSISEVDVNDPTVELTPSQQFYRDYPEHRGNFTCSTRWWDETDICMVRLPDQTWTEITITRDQ